jgi:UDP-4-amino-4-deoxy-L-arabinose-oxoglutarate aminotransferase
MLAQGELVARFEAAVATWVGAQGAVASGSGSSAITLALLGLGLRDGDQVILPTYICRSVYEAVLTSGATPVLADSGEDWLLSPAAVERALTTRTKALIVAPLYGIYADLAPFRKFGIAIIEDCAQVFPGPNHEMQGDIAVFSFHPTKCLTTGEGGMATAGSAELVARLRAIRDGMEGELTSRLFSPLSDLSAALGISQLARYCDMLARREQFALRYRRAIDRCLPEALNGEAFERSMHFRFVLRVARGFDCYAERFARHGVIVRRGVDELLHRVSGTDERHFPVACRLFQETLSLPIYPALNEDEFSRCVAAATDVLSSV